jgi:hypothetical protein
MATQIVMDHNGDTQHNFDANDAKALFESRQTLQRTIGRRLYGGNSYCFWRANCETRV